MSEAATEKSTLNPEVQENLARLAIDMANNPKTRQSFLKAAKEVRPNASIPELDTQAVIDERFKAFEKKLDERDSLDRDQRLKDELARQKGDVKTKFGLSDEDFPKMEEMMKKGELPADYRWAAPLFKQQTEQAAPTSYGTGGYGPLDITGNAKQFEGLMENEAAWSMKTAHSMIDEMQKKGRAGAF